MRLGERVCGYETWRECVCVGMRLGERVCVGMRLGESVCVGMSGCAAAVVQVMNGVLGDRTTEAVVVISTKPGCFIAGADVKSVVNTRVYMSTF